MDENLTVNTKLFDYKGVIGLRDFFLNILYVLMASALFWASPFLMLLIPKALDKELLSSVILIMLALSAIVIFILSLPSLIKRLNDINGKFDKRFSVIYLICFSLMLILSIFSHSIFIFH